MTFWTDAKDEHRKIAQTFYQNIEYDHPDYITSDGRGTRYVNRDGWNITCVKYYEYTGPNVQHI